MNLSGHNSIENHSVKIMIVDDNEDIREILEDILVLEGYQVETFSQAEEAMTRGMADPPDLFLLDIRMPGIDGFELCSRLKEAPATQSVPVIFISGLLGMEEKVKGFKAGGADYITKPFHNIDVLIRVQTHVKLRKNAQELESVNEILEEKVQQRTEELLKAKNAAEKANNAKSEFLSNINHEMRTPLNGILGMLKLMSNLEMDEDMEMYHNLADFSARHLSAVISDILDYTQLDGASMKFRYKTLNVTSLIDHICRLHQAQAESKGLKLLWDIGGTEIHFVSDEIRLAQILSNLITNAIKYSRTGEIVIRANLKGSLKVEVEDQGIGIPSDKLEDIFKPFLQLESPYTKEHNGTGLGLPICRNLAEAMGGSIQIESEVAKGSCFTLTLPMGQDMAPERRNPVEKVKLKEERALRILAVEDDTINLYLLENILESRGWEVFQAVNGDEALEELDACHPDIVLLDMGLPKKSGLDVLKEIRKNKASAHLPVIAVTAYSHKTDLERFEKAGVNDIITKPISEDALINSIVKLMDSDS